MAEHTEIEYGVIVDRASKGLGYWLAETFRGRDLDRAQALADRSEALFGFPAALKQRTVTKTDWELVTRPASNGAPDA